MELLNNKLLGKFSGLLFFLKKSKIEFEMVADEIENNPLRSALNSLSDDSSYYAGELKNYLASLGVAASGDVITDDPLLVQDYSSEENSAAGDELMYICSHNENKLTDAYSELLNGEDLPYPTLKEVLLYQLNALKYTFLKVKTLNNARFA